MKTAVENGYITRNEKILGGEPVIKDTRTSVRTIAEMWRLGYAPEEIPGHLPHLTLAEVFASLSYYSDNQAEINGYIGKNRFPKEMMHPLVRDL